MQINKTKLILIYPWMKRILLLSFEMTKVKGTKNYGSGWKIQLAL